MTPNGTNVGYGRGHNDNLTRCRGSYVLVLNPDLEFDMGLFAGLASHLEKNPSVAIAGPRILEGVNRRPFPPRYFYPGEGMVALERGLRRTEIAWLSGCCFIVRRGVFEALGGFDPDFFLYQEDTDFCLRTRRAGHRIGYVPSTMVHQRGMRLIGLAGMPGRIARRQLRVALG